MVLCVTLGHGLFFIYPDSSEEIGDYLMIVVITAILASAFMVFARAFRKLATWIKNRRKSKIHNSKP